jgi:hypothetical protein
MQEQRIEQPVPYPAELTDRPQWLVWRYITKPGQKKPAKMPYYVNGNLRGWPMGKPRDGIATNEQPQVEQGHEWDREALATYADAALAADTGRYDGIGFAFLPDDGLIGIDLDATLPVERQQAIRDACDTFCEASPSGTGLHIIGLGTVETFKSNDVGIEVFCGRQFFTMPGQHDPASPFEIREIPAATLEKLRRTVEQAKEAARQAREAAKPQQAASAPRAAPATNTEAMRYCLHALQSAVQRISGMAEGGRNDALNQEAYGLGQLLHFGVFTETTAAAELASAAAACGLPHGEAAGTIRSGLRSGQERPRSLPQRERPITPRSGNPAPAPASAITPESIDPETGEILDTPEPANDNAAPASEFGEPLDVFGIKPPPELPMDCLPAQIIAYVEDQAALTGCDPAIIGMSAIVAAAACITDGIKLQPKRHDPTWTESARLWVAVVGDPSTKKSPAISKAVRHVKRLDHRMAEDNASAFADYKWQHDQWKEAKKADKNNPPPEPKIPPMKRLVVEDITVEALTEVLKDNPRGVLTLKDELTGWFASMDAYKGATKGASMDRAHWLEAYNGGRRSIDRVTRGSVIVPNWSTCIIGGVQPDMMRRVASSMGNDGLLQRFMVLVARPAVVDVDRTPDMRAMDAFSALFDHLAGLQPSETPVTLTEEAHHSREKVARYAKRMIDAFDNPHVQAWLGKWDGLYARLLLLYHCIECARYSIHPANEQVSGETADQVERLMCGVLLHHAIHFYGEIIDANERQEHIRQLARLILAKRFDRITKRDITLLWKASRRMEWWELRQVIDALCTMDWLLPDQTALDTDGKPRAWFVNAAVHSMFSEAASREQARRKAATETLRDIRQAYEQGA